DYDELYWNVTGNGWGFPIDRASATITLPAPAAFGQRAAYTGPQGSTASNAEVVAESPGSITFATTSTLAPYEGLTIAAAFPKGVVDEPSDNQKLGWWLTDFLPMLAAAAGLLGIISYLYYAWARAGRDPRPGTVVPLFSPPDDLSPAAMRYVVKQGIDNRAFAAALVEAGVKGHVKLVEEKGFLIFGGDKYIEGLATAPTAPLDTAEQAAVSGLVAPGVRVELDNKNHSAFSTARTKLEQAYKQRFDGKAFKRNYEWAGSALLVWAFAAYLTLLAIVVAEGVGMTALFFLPLLAFAGGWMLWRLADGASQVFGCLVKLGAFLLFFVGGGMSLAAIP
ncbi:MAG: DUF2207 domain-containing protein, partial [Sphingomicrobium sp.]